MVSKISVFGLLCVLACLIANAEVPIQTTPCELKANPLTYDERVITLRSAVTIGFENSSFDVTCPDSDLESVWVTFAGDVEMPVIYCCGDHNRKPGESLSINGINLKLTKDAQFKKYTNLLFAVRKQAPTGVECFWDCFQYRVTATLTGHFFAKKDEKNSEDGLTYTTGYGHFGFSNLFVIERVTDVVAQPTGIPIGDDFNCDYKNWNLPIEQSAIMAQQSAVKSKFSPEPDITKIGDQLIREKMLDFGDNFDLGDTQDNYQGKFEREKIATFVWLSKDKLKSYKITFQRFDWLSKIEKKINDRIWTPVRIERGLCTPE
jgi:hypothetical protein